MEILRKIGKQNELGFKRWLPSSHHLGYMEAIRKTKIPLKLKLGYTLTTGTLGNCLRRHHRTDARRPHFA
jgi:hypothetical protein